MIKKAAVYFLSLCMLVASIPVEVYAHTCLLFGHTDVSLFTPVACCGDEATDADTTSLDVKCCSVSHEVLTSEVRSGELTPQTSTTPQLVAVFSSLLYIIPERTFQEHTPVHYCSSNHPPYLSAPIYLQVQTFLI